MNSHMDYLTLTTTEEMSLRKIFKLKSFQSLSAIGKRCPQPNCESHRDTPLKMANHFITAHPRVWTNRFRSVQESSALQEALDAE